jgi:Mn-dependent DtxR family transcriptional regulator
MIEISREEFLKKYLTMTVKDLAQELGVSKVSVNNIRKKLKIKSKGGFGDSRKVKIV